MGNLVNIFVIYDLGDLIFIIGRVLLRFVILCQAIYRNIIILVIKETMVFFYWKILINILSIYPQINKVYVLTYTYYYYCCYLYYYLHYYLY